jgi:acetate kinase
MSSLTLVFNQGSSSIKFAFFDGVERRNKQWIAARHALPVLPKDEHPAVSADVR